MNWMKVERILRAKALHLFTPLEFQRTLGVSPISERFLVHRYTKRGAFLKLRKGLYALADEPPSDLVIANRLYAPSYLSFEFALSYYHLIPESVYVLTSATTRPTRTLTAAGKLFEYHRIKREAFTGYEPVKGERGVVWIATPEKALTDFLYFVDLKKKPFSERVQLRGLLWSWVEAYARLFGRPSLLRLVKRLHA